MPDRRSPLALAAWAAAASLGAVVVASSSPAQQQALQPLLEGHELLAALREGGLVILMRHQTTDDFVPDEGTLDVVECQTQRNLSEEGRAQSKAIGKAIASLKIPIGSVLSSPYCRCVETGMLIFGRVEQEPDLAVFDELEGAAKEVRAMRIREMLNTPPAKPGNAVLITHTGSLLYSFGLQTRPEGIAHVFRPMEFGQAVYVGRVLPEDWSVWAAAGS